MTTPHTRGRVPPDFTANVRAEIARDAHGISFREVARRAGIPWSTWQRRMVGTDPERPTPWTARELDAIAHVLGIDVVRLYRRPS